MTRRARNPATPGYAGVEPAGTDVLKPADVAVWLQVDERQLHRFGIPVLSFGRKTRRYLRSDVLAWLDAKRVGKRGHSA